MGKVPRYKVIVSDRARQMLGVHVRFMANVSPPAARKTKSEILKAIRSLSMMPERFSFLDAQHIPPNKYHKMFAENWYMILYQVKDSNVYVDYIVDCRQNYEWLIK